MSSSPLWLVLLPSRRIHQDVFVTTMASLPPQPEVPPGCLRHHYGLSSSPTGESTRMSWSPLWLVFLLNRRIQEDVFVTTMASLPPQREDPPGCLRHHYGQSSSSTGGSTRMSSSPLWLVFLLNRRIHQDVFVTTMVSLPPQPEDPPGCLRHHYGLSSSPTGGSTRMSSSPLWLVSLLNRRIHQDVFVTTMASLRPQPEDPPGCLRHHYG